MVTGDEGKIIEAAGDKRVGLKLLTVALLACGLCLLASAPASAAPAWLSPTDLSAPLRDANNVDVAMDDAGDLVSVWERSGTPSHPIQASVRPAGGGYSAPIELAATGTSPGVAMTPSGTAFVVYAQFDPVSAKNLIRVRMQPPGGSFAPPIDVAALAPGFSVNPELAVNANGDAAVVWLSKNAESNFVATVATRAADGSFSSPVALSNPEHNASSPQVAVDASGRATVVWSGFSGSNPNVIQLSSGSGASFSSPVDLSSVAAASSPQVALDLAGAPTVIWTGFPELLPTVIEARTAVGGVFSAATPLSNPSQNASAPRLAIGPGGEAVAVWVASEAAETVQAATRSGGGTFSAPVDLSAQGADAASPQVAVNGAGAATVAWQRGNPGAVQASTRAPNGAFVPAVDVSQGGREALFPEVAMDRAGDAVAAWRRSNGANEIAQAAGYDADAPLLRNVSIPASGMVGAPISFSASPFDVWSIASTGFGFGDGAAAAGTSVSHAYSAPGTYLVTVTSKDAAGTASMASGSIAIRPSNDFVIKKLLRNKKKGTGTLVVTVPGPGLLVLRAKGVKRVSKRAARAGDVKIPVKPTGKLRKKLAQRGRAKVGLAITFTPDGGEALVKRKKAALIEKLP
jgi:hypothetical protein